jgi:hypothetical protein
MKSATLIAAIAATMAGCTMNGGPLVTAWGKKDVSMLEYRTDAGQCAVLAVTTTPDANGAKTAGGISGQNGAPPAGPPASGSADAASGRSNNSGASTPADSGNGGMYRDSAPPDFVNRAVAQQHNQEIAAQRARHDLLKSCLVKRGYTEFSLTAAQRAELGKLAAGSDARRDYLYKLGTDPDVLTKQSVAQK